MQDVFKLFIDTSPFFFLTCSPGSVGVDYVATFNTTAGVNSNNLKNELANALNTTNNGTFLADSDLKLSEETDPTKVIEALEFTGNVLHATITE